MRRNAFQLSRRHKTALYTITGAVFLTGAVWALLHHFFRVETDFGTELHPAEPWLLRAHGAAAMATILVVGTLLPIHVKKSWLARQNRGTGVGLLAFFGILTLSGYGLYYASGEDFRNLTAIVHLWLGLLLPVILIGHILRGHWLRRHGRFRQNQNHGNH